MGVSPRRQALALSAACWAALIWLLVDRTPRRPTYVAPDAPTGLSFAAMLAPNVTRGLPVEPAPWLSAACADAWVSRGEVCEVPLTARDTTIDVAVAWGADSSAPAWTRRPTLRYLLRSLLRLRQTGRVGRISLLVDRVAPDGRIALPTWLNASRAELGGLDVIAPRPGRSALLNVLRHSSAAAVLVLPNDTLLPAGLEQADVASPAYGPVLRFDYDAAPAAALDQGTLVVSTRS